MIKQNRAAAPKLAAAGPVKQTVFKSTRQPDGTWGPAQRQAAPLNNEISSSGVVTALAVDATGRMAFMSLGERGKEDLYEFELPAAMRPLPVAFVHGTVTDPAGKPVPAGILYEFLTNTRQAGQAGANPQDGQYQIALPIGDDYGFRASASGYIAISDRIDLRQAKDQQRYERNLVLIPIARSRAIRGIWRRTRRPAGRRRARSCGAPAATPARRCRARC